MFNKYILLVPSAFLLKKYINSVNNKESYNISDDVVEDTHLKCGINFVKALHIHVHLQIITEVYRILSQVDVLDLIKCIYDNKCNETNKDIPVNLLKINIPELTAWETKTTSEDRNAEFNLIINNVTSKITNELGIDIPTDSKIINLYLKDVYVNQINRFNEGVAMKICKSKTNQDQLKFCDQLINKLISFLPQYVNNLEYLKNNKSKKTVLEQALLNTQDKFNNLNNTVSNCSEINDADIPNIKNMELIEKINSIKQIKSENDGKSRLDQLTEAANIHEKKKQISDLTLKEVVYNTNYTMLKLLELISKMLSSTSKKTVIDDDVNENDKYDKGFYTKNNLNNIITFLKKDENLFYTGVFLIVFALIMYAMNN